MIVALLNQKGGVGKTTLALHLAGRWAGKGRRVLVVDADPQGSALDWSEQRASLGHPRLFGVLGLPRETLHRGCRLSGSGSWSVNGRVWVSLTKCGSVESPQFRI